MIPFEELCEALDQYRRRMSGEPEPAPAEERHAAASEPTRMDMEAPELPAGGEPEGSETGEIDLGDVVEEN